MGTDPSGHSIKSWFKNRSSDWNVGINALQDMGSGGRAFANYSSGVVDTINAQAGSIIRTIKHPGKAISNLATDYTAHGKSDWKNWHPANYIGTKIAEGLSNQVQASYNLGLNYGLDGIMYGIGQGTTIVAETGAMAYGSEIITNKFANIKNVLPKNRTELHQNLLEKGYRCNGTSQGGYVTYMRDDGMRVDIRPNGEIITTKKEWLPDGSKKIAIRYQWDGTPVPNGGHNTGEFVETIGENTFLPPKP